MNKKIMHIITVEVILCTMDLLGKVNNKTSREKSESYDIIVNIIKI